MRGLGERKGNRYDTGIIFCRISRVPRVNGNILRNSCRQVVKERENDIAPTIQIGEFVVD